MYLFCSYTDDYLNLSYPPLLGAVAVSRFSWVDLNKVVITRFIRVIQKVCGALDTPVKPKYDGFLCKFGALTMITTVKTTNDLFILETATASIKRAGG
jgi:hypothetical protein